MIYHNHEKRKQRETQSQQEKMLSPVRRLKKGARKRKNSREGKR
jgi:hypothetical protein